MQLSVVRPVPRWVTVVTVLSVAVVAAVAAVVSYVHMRELATRAGEAWRADIIPLSADGLLVAASMVMFVRRQAGERAGVLPWVGLVLGLAASLAANLAVADWGDPVSLAVSGWPPVALAVAFELLILVTRKRSAGASAAEPVAAPVDPTEEPTATADDRAAELIAQGAGRRRLARELKIPESQARALLAAARNGHGS